MKKISLFPSLLMFKVCALGFAASFVNAQQPENLTSGLVAYYPLNGDTYDYSGNNKHAVASGGVTFAVGKNGKAAATFTSQGQYISVEGITATNKTYSWSCWFKLSNATNYAPLLNLGTDVGVWNYNPAVDIFPSTVDTNVFTFTEASYTRSNSIRFLTYSFPSPWAIFCQTNISWTSWNHVVAVSTTNNTGLIYLNGKLVSSGYANNGVSGNGLVCDTLYIGGVGGATPVTSMKGQLDDVRIYNRALSATEVSQLYAVESQVTETLVKIWAPTNTPVRLGIGLSDVTNVAAPILPYGWKFDAPSAQIFGRMTGTNPMSAIITGERGTNPPVSVSFPLELLPQVTQSIAFTVRANAKVGDVLPLLTSSSSKLPVTVTSSDPNILRVEGSTAAAFSKGRVTLTATQDGNEQFAPATPIRRTVNIR